MGPWIPVSGMPDFALFSVSASWGSCVSGKNTNYSHRSRNTFKLLFKSKINVEINHWDHDFQFPECLIPHFFSVSASWGSWVSGKKTIILSTVPGIPSSYFSNQRLKLKLTIGTMNYSFRIAWFRTFSRFCKLRQLRFWIKNNISINRSRNTFKLLLKSKINVEINHWDQEFQFPECLIPHFFPFLQVEAVACLKENNNSINRSRNTFKLLLKSKIKVEIIHWDHEFQFPESLFPHFFSVSASWVSCVSGKNQ